MTAVQTAAAETPTRRIRSKKKVVAAASAPIPAKKKTKKKAAAAPAEIPTGVYVNKATGRYEITVFWGAYKSVAEAVHARDYARQCKAAYKDSLAS